MNLDAIWQRAKSDLIFTNDRGATDLLLWDHAERVACAVQSIASMDAARALAPDVPATIAAALYHEAGTVKQLRRSHATDDHAGFGSQVEMSCELSAGVLERQLANLLPADSIARAAAAIYSLADHTVTSVEGDILSDADHLEEFGVLSLWATIRRTALEGKGVQALIDTWQRQQEYQYWEARLKDTFHFAEVRLAAQRRLEQFGQFMRDIDRQHRALDLQSNLDPTADTRRDSPAEL